LDCQQRYLGMSAQDKIKPDFQKIANDDAEFREITAYSGITVMESHQAWCGPCDCIRPNLWKLSLADESLKFATACSDKVPLLKEYTGKVQPIFFIYKGGKRMATIEGVNGNLHFLHRNDTCNHLMWKLTYVRSSGNSSTNSKGKIEKTAEKGC
jgi:hypothetical protein